MARFIGFRIIDAIPTMLLVLTLIFVVLRLLPGDPGVAVLGDQATPEQLEIFRQKLGLDRPVLEQYVTFLWSVLRLDFGHSYINGRPISELLLQNLPFTIELALLGTAIGAVAGIVIGVITATRRDSAVDYTVRVGALLGFAIPDFYLGALLLIAFSLNFGLFPINGGGVGFLDRLHHLVLPALALGFIKASFLSRLTRATLLEVLGRDYVRTARAKGARERRVIYRHALFNALPPVVAGLGLSILSTLSGSVAIELIFGRPGLGSLLISGINNRDYPLIQAGLVVFALCVVVVNLIVDIVTILIDPRTRAE